ncbi:MAG: hypothetical protein MUF49_05920 [Oculatellaceae cyanobacterium Prado106]|nr:hypothetical protein [Oculatellaceae cyanobacterium Prado106]
MNQEWSFLTAIEFAPEVSSIAFALVAPPLVSDVDHSQDRFCGAWGRGLPGQTSRFWRSPIRLAIAEFTVIERALSG